MFFGLGAIAVAIVYLSRTLLKGLTMSKDALDRLTREVGEMVAAVKAATDVIAAVPQQIRDNAADPVALNGLADKLDAAQADLAAAAALISPAADPAAVDPAPVAAVEQTTA
jgi:hypothetical protein